jgi:NNP family nitrate/nitrite transporter-like MFS transporter
MAALSLTGAMVRPVGGLIADRLSGAKVLLMLLLVISLCNFAFAMLMPSLGGGVALLVVLYLAFGLGNGATFQLVPHRWKGRTGVMTGIIGAAGGIGGFYLPVVMGMARENTGSYQLGFITFGILAALAFVLVAALRQQWLVWALPQSTDAGLGAPLAQTE